MVKFYSWNVNGIRAVINKGAWADFLRQHHPDVLGLQEIKAQPEQISLPKNGFETFWYPADKAGYSGVAILTKLHPLKVSLGLPKEIIQAHDLRGDLYGNPNQEGRIITAEYDNYYLVSVYTPNAKDDLSRLELRFKHWDPAFLDYLLQLEKHKPVIVCGDLNVAHTEDDLANPKPNQGKKGFTQEERAGLSAIIDAGFIDAFRLFHRGNGFYTWWSHFANARARNVGWRIDYFLISRSLQSHVVAADIHPSVLGSDHCPISLTLDF